MKKNYSTPEFMLVALDSNDLICTSEDVSYGGKWDPNNGNPTAGAKRRDNNIWDE